MSLRTLLKCLTDETTVLIQATDGDIGVNAAFLYSILSGDSDYSFTVDPASGVLSTTGPLDREEHDSYILLVRVSDLHGNHSYGVVFDDSTVVEVVVEVNGSPLRNSGFQVNVTIVEMAKRKFGDRYDHMGQLFIDRCVNESILLLPRRPEAFLWSRPLTNTKDPGL